MKKYTFSEKVGKKVTKYEIVAETLTEAQMQLAEKLETIKGINVVGVGLPDYIEPIDPPTDLTLKTFNITYRRDPDDKDTSETITYKALSLNSAEGQFLEDFPEQAGQSRETHMPLGNYAIDRENAKVKDYLGNIFHDPEARTESEKLQDELEPIDEYTTKEGRMSHEQPVKSNGMFATATAYAKLFTSFFVSLIGLGLISAVLFGIDGGFGIVENISTLLSDLGGLAGLVVLFLVYFLFIRSGDEKKS